MIQRHARRLLSAAAARATALYTADCVLLLHARSPSIHCVITCASDSPAMLLRRTELQAAWWIKSLDPNHMVTTGEEGYRTEGPKLGRHEW